MKRFEDILVLKLKSKVFRIVDINDAAMCKILSLIPVLYKM